MKNTGQVSANAGKSTGIQAAVNAGTRVDVSILASEIRSTFGVSGQKLFIEVFGLNACEFCDHAPCFDLKVFT